MSPSFFFEVNKLEVNTNFHVKDILVSPDMASIQTCMLIHFCKSLDTMALNHCTIERNSLFLSVLLWLSVFAC